MRASVGESADDFRDLQRQVIDRRAELLRAWNAQVAKAPAPAALEADWNSLASRAWDFGHETFQWYYPSAQDDRGRKLLAELYAMDQRFRAAKVAPEAMGAPPPAPPPVNPEHLQAGFFGNLGADLELLLLVAGLAFLGGRK